MKIKRFIILYLFIVVCLTSLAQTNNIGIGQWRAHLSYSQTHQVTKVGDEVLVAAQSALFYYNPQTQEIRTLNKVNGLSDAGIDVMAYDTITKSTVITYENSNIDIVQGSNVYNIPDIKNRAIEGSKAINSIYFSNDKAYLSCGFGVVVLDLQRHEIYDTWYLGKNSSAINVNCIYIDDTSIYAGTVNGLLYADKDSKTLAASQTWKNKNLSEKNKEVKDIIPFENNTILLNILRDNSTHSDLLKYDGEKSDTIWSDVFMNKIKRYGDKIGVIYYMYMTVYDMDFKQLVAYSNEWNPIPGIREINFKDFCIDDTDIWFSHTSTGLIHIPDYINGSTANAKIIYPTGPMSNSVFGLTYSDDGYLYVAPGGKNADNSNKYMPADIYTYNGFYWTVLEYGATSEGLIDVVDIAIDPKDKNHLVAASWNNGVIDINNNTITTIYDSTNTDNLLRPYDLPGGGWTYRVASVKYDRSGNMFAAVSLVPYGFVYKTKTGEWGNFYTQPYIGGDEIKGMTLDYFNSYKLIYTASGKILLLNNQGEMKLIDANNGSLLSTSTVNCMTQDKDGEIWIGTEKGIKVIYSLTGAFDMGSSNYNVQCNNIVYNEDGIPQYLLSFENISCIMIDGANRKWIGTERSGVYVLSANGDKEYYHFTLENSPLISNKITALAQNPLTGEVFIGTDRGIVSYRAESLTPETEDRELRVFPNPVRPDYNGLIAIKGFVEDSDVRITDANGQMVAHLKSLGGQAVWDGRNFEGNKVASGVYFVFSSANEGNNKAKGKFLIVR